MLFTLLFTLKLWKDLQGRMRDKVVRMDMIFLSGMYCLPHACESVCVFVPTVEHQEGVCDQLGPPLPSTHV